LTRARYFLKSANILSPEIPPPVPGTAMPRIGFVIREAGRELEKMGVGSRSTGLLMESAA
jgi:hypothetical protein